MPQYTSGLRNLPDGSVMYLPGSTVFEMPGAIPSEIDIFTIDTIQRYPLGTKLERGDNVFRYVEFGNTTAAGDMIQAEGPDGAHDDLDPSGGLVAVGSKVITISTAITLVKDEYAGGYLVIEADAGAGYAYQVTANDADAAAGGATVTIRDGLAVAITSASDAKLVKSRYKEVIEMPATVTGLVVGASLGVGADGSFGWATTRGPAAVLTDGTVVIGQHVRASDGTAGSVEALDRDGSAEDEPELGYVMDVGPNTEFSLIFLTTE